MLTAPLLAQRYEQKPPEKTRILFLLDGSGSMLGTWNDGRLKIDVAKTLLGDLIDSLKVNKNLELALRVYGHQHDRRLQVCTDSKLEIGFRANNHQDLVLKLRTIQPKGTTPIAYSLEQAANDFPTADKKIRNVIIIITDGLESCDGDPCAVSLALQKKNIFLKPFVIGLGLNESYTDSFGCLGRFFDVTDVQEFRESLDEAIRQTLDKTTVSVELLDHRNNKVVKDLNVSFTNRTTGESAYDFVHYRDRAGRPDSVEIDAILDYDLTVYSVPPVTLKNVNINPGRHNVIPIKIPQGTLSLTMPGYSEYGRKIPVVVRRNNGAEILNKQEFRESYQYLAGTYDLEIFTMPKTIIKGYQISAGETNTVTLAKPGVVNFILGAKGFGSLYRWNNTEQEWVYNFPYSTTQWTTAMQPGKYKLVYRADFAKGSKYTKIKEFTVTSGSTQTINVNR